MRRVRRVGLLAGLIFAPEIFGPILIVKGLTEAVTGQDLVTGEPLDWKLRALGALPVLGVYGQELRVGTSLLREEEALSQADRAASQAWRIVPLASSTSSAEPILTISRRAAARLLGDAA